MNLSLPLIVLTPPAAVTVMSTAPLPAGAVAVIDVALSTLNNAAPVEPNFTAVAPLRFVPPMRTLVPPEAGPWLGLIDVIAGTAA